MKEELQGKLVEILTSIQTAAGKASDFAMEQLPDVAQSYVAYGRAWSTAGAVFGLVLLGIAAWLFHVGWREKRRSDDAWKAEHPGERMGYFDRYDPFGYWFPAAFIAAGGMISTAAFAHVALLVWFAPKVWLLKEIASLLK
jgi:hypothetical protein